MGVRAVGVFGLEAVFVRVLNVQAVARLNLFSWSVLINGARVLEIASTVSGRAVSRGIQVLSPESGDW